MRRPLTLTIEMTGEHFELQRSARAPGGDGHFRFRWTLNPGKKGPPEHIHTETESFRIVSGTLRIWMSGVPKDYAPGDTVSIPPRVRHRFLNPGDVPVVVDVALDGPKMEDAFAPLAIHFEGRSRPTLGEIVRVMVHDVEIGASIPASPVAHAVMRAMARTLRALGVKPFAPVSSDWAEGREAQVLPTAA